MNDFMLLVWRLHLGGQFYFTFFWSERFECTHNFSHFILELLLFMVTIYCNNSCTVRPGTDGSALKWFDRQRAMSHRGSQSRNAPLYTSVEPKLVIGMDNCCCTVCISVLQFTTSWFTQDETTDLGPVHSRMYLLFLYSLDVFSMQCATPLCRTST